MQYWKMQGIKLLLKGSILSLLIILSHLNVFAQDSLTVEQAVATALQNNYDIILSRNDSAIAAINIDYRNAAFFPKLNASSTVLFNNNAQKQKLQDGTIKDRTGIRSNNINAALSLNWVVFDGFKMFVAREQMDQAVKVGNLEIKNQVINTVSDVIKTYYDIVHQKQLLKNIEEQMQLSADRLKLSQYKLDRGAGIKPDVLQAEIDYNNEKASRLNQLTIIDQRKQSLNLLMNVPRDINYKVSDSIPIQTDIVLGNLLNNIEETSPALRLARTSIEVAELNVKSAKTNRYPVVSLVSAYNFSQVNNNTVVNPIQQPLFNLNKGWNYGISASIPILNNFTVRQQIRQAGLAVNYQQLRYESQQAVVNTNLLNTYRTYESQAQIAAISDSSVTLARENLFIERERYRLGNTTFIELRQAEENLATAITNVITARYNWKVAETELLRLKGDLVR
jgi:outer membrane protein